MMTAEQRAFVERMLNAPDTEVHPEVKRQLMERVANEAKSVRSGVGVPASLQTVRANVQSAPGAEARHAAGRPIAGLGGALLGGAAGIPGGPGAITIGGIGGYSGATTLFDLLSGEYPGRIGAQTLGVGGALELAELGLFPELGPGGVGLVNALAGQAHDIVYNAVTGKRPTWAETTGRAAEDVVSGYVGERLAGEGQTRIAERTARRERELAAQAERRRVFEAAEIPAYPAEILGTEGPWGDYPEYITGVVEARSRAGAASRRFGERRERLLTGERDPAGRLIPGTGSIPRAIEDITPGERATDEETASQIIGPTMDQARERWRRENRDAFEHAEAAVGPGSIFEFPHLRAAARELLTDIPAEPRTEPATIVVRGEEVPNPRAGREMIFDPYSENSTDVAGNLVGLSADEMVRRTMDYRTVPLRSARRILSVLGDRANGKEVVVGGPSQATYKQLHNAAMEDWNAFFDADHGLATPAQRAAWDRALEHHRRFVAIYNNSVVRQFFKKGAGAAAKLELAFTPGNIEATRDVYGEIGATPAWTRAAQGWLKSLYAKHNRTGVFDREGWANDVLELDRTGQLDLMLPSASAGRFRKTAAAIRLMRTTGKPGEYASGRAMGRLPEYLVGQALGGIHGGLAALGIDFISPRLVGDATAGANRELMTRAMTTHVPRFLPTSPALSPALGSSVGTSLGTPLLGGANVFGRLLP